MSAQILTAHFPNFSSLFWARLCDYTDNDGGGIELHLICYLGADGGSQDQAAGVRLCAAHGPEQELLPSHEFWGDEDVLDVWTTWSSLFTKALSPLEGAEFASIPLHGSVKKKKKTNKQKKITRWK